MRVRVREKVEAMITTKWPYIPPADKRNWHPAVDLRVAGNICKISEFPEVKQVPELKDILERLNSPNSSVFTIGCRAERACKCSRIDCEKRYYYSTSMFVSSKDNSISGSNQRTIDALVVPLREQMEQYKSPQQSDFFEISLSPYVIEGFEKSWMAGLHSYCTDINRVGRCITILREGARIISQERRS